MLRRPIRHGFRLIQALSVSSVLAAACSTSSPGPTSPSIGSGGLPSMTVTGQHGIELTPIVGSGSGIVNDTATADDCGFPLCAQVNINVHGAPPDSLLYVQIAADAGLPGGQQTDGSCERAAADLFAPLALYPGGPPATLQTTSAGTGTVHTTAGINNPFLPDGAKTDLVIRVVDALAPATPTVELRTPCYQFQVK
jgi:hypothetical protein